MIRKFRVCFYLRSYKTKEGKSPILVRLYLNGERMILGSAGFNVEEKQWDKSKGRVKGRTSEANKVNEALERIELDLMHVYRRCEFSDTLSLDVIKALYLGKSSDSDSFFKFFDDFLTKLKEEVGISRSQASYTKYDVIRRRFATFLKERFGRSDLRMGELSYKYISDFEHYCLTAIKLKQNTTMRIMRNLKTVILRAQKMGLLKNDPFLNFKIRFEKTDRGFLSDEEIAKLMNHRFSVKRLEQVRDIFVFSCFTGLAYIDLVQLSKEHIVKIDGREWIMKNRQKTDVPSSVLLLDVAKQILNKYKEQMADDPHGRLLPVCSNQKMNAYLKEIADLCGIEKRLSCHLARHTFATLALSKGVSVESVSRMLGHTNIQTTQIYARIVNKKIESDMLSLSSKLDFVSAAL